MTSGESGSRSDSDVEEDEMKKDGKRDGAQVKEARPRDWVTDDEHLPELVEYLRQNRKDLREEWVGRITDAELLEEMSRDEIFSEASDIYDNYVDALETGRVETLQAYARDLSERIVARGVETDDVLGIVLLLRDVLERALFANYGQDAEVLNEILDAYEPAANRIMVTVGVSFVAERERVIREQQEAIRKLSTPVMKLRERLLLLPIIGALDTKRIKQLTEQLLEEIQAHRAKVVVIDITGVAEVDREVANHLVQTVEAAGLMGAETIVTGLSSEIAQTLVDLEVELARMKTVGDLQGGLEEAERLLGQSPDERPQTKQSPEE
jgi:rsbT co-antagonist protein RsbR